MFPLLQLGSRPSPHVDPAIDALRDAGLLAERVRCDYEFQRGGNEYLRVRRVSD